jgi:methionyl-tRNA synthetase
MPRRFYITTPIYYVNDVPHLGTAYTTIAADAFRRYHALRGEDARMLTGTDEHGLKLDREAKERGMDPHAFVAEMSARFRAAWPQLDVEFDDFISTGEKRHISFVQDLWHKVKANGHLYPGTYEDWYCVACESFKTEKELLPGNLCAIHQRPVERLKEETYFFDLSKWQDRLLELYEKHPEFVQPATRRNEVVSFVKGELRDLSVSRTSFTWGIPVPDDPKHIMYVWFDALANYRSALGDAHAEYWPPGGKAVHLVGKDILRFHAVYWPAFLMAAGYDLPTTVYAHGFLTIDGQKMSKTLRNAVDPLRLAKELGADVVRYHLLRAVAFGQDGDFDHAALLERYNADLGKNLGNLLQRTLGLCAKMTGSKTPAVHARGELEASLDATARACAREAASAWESFAPHVALEKTWELCSAANQYVDRAAPWAEAKKGDQARVDTILAHLVAVLEQVSVVIWPAMPKKSDAMRAQLGLAPIKTAVDKDLWPGELRFEAGRALSAGEPLFPTFDDKTKKEMLERLVPKVEVAAERTEEIAYDAFAAVDLRVGVVKTCERVPKKDKLLRLLVDIGEPEPRQIVAGLALSFAPEALVGRKVVVVANLAPRDFGKGLVSRGMLLATGPSEALCLATVDGDAAAGMRLK